MHHLRHDFCEGNHPSKDCQVRNLSAQTEQVNYMNNFQQEQDNSQEKAYPHQHNPNWQNNHPNLSWSNNNNTLQPQQNYNAPGRKRTLKICLGNFL